MPRSKKNNFEEVAEHHRQQLARLTEEQRALFDREMLEQGHQLRAGLLRAQAKAGANQRSINSGSERAGEL